MFAVVHPKLSSLVDRAAVEAAIDVIIAPPLDDHNRKVMLSLVMQGISDSALEVAAFEVVNAAVPSFLRMAPDLSAEILHGARLILGANPTLSELLTAGKIVENDGKNEWQWNAATPDLQEAIRLAHSVLGLIAPFDPSAETLAFMFEHAGALGWLALDGVPLPTGAQSLALTRWLELAEVFALIAEFPAVPLPGQLGKTVTVLAVFHRAFGLLPISTLPFGASEQSATVPPPLQPTAMAISALPSILLPDPKGPGLDALAVLTGWPRDRLGEADGSGGKGSCWACPIGLSRRRAFPGNLYRHDVAPIEAGDLAAFVARTARVERLHDSLAARTSRVEEDGFPSDA